MAQVPLLSLLLLGRGVFGARTWLGCVTAFAAAVLPAACSALGSALAGGPAGGAGAAEGMRETSPDGRSSVVGTVQLVASAVVYSLSTVRTQASKQAI